MTITIHIHELNLLEDTLQNQYDSNFESDHEMLRDEINKSDFINFPLLRKLILCSQLLLLVLET